VICYRPFLNSDPPLLAAIWQGCAGRRGLAQPMTALMFEQFVLAKPYFDREGLILALDDARPIGFVHAGFGPNETGSKPSNAVGAIVMLLAVAHPEQESVAKQLLALGEEYLERRGAKTIYGGGVRPVTPFYWGLYGGSEPPGVLDSDVKTQEILRAANYQPIDRTLIYHRKLGSFRPLVDRQQMQIRRCTEVEMVPDPKPRCWWDACTMEPSERTLFRLRPRAGGEPLGQVTFWNVEPFAAPWGVRASGLIDLEIDPANRRKGLALYLIGEALRQLQEQAFVLIEVQAVERNTAALALYAKLGFEKVDSGTVFRKDVSSGS
jgi:ribosomal protein S18 acetylase RimI-like enzyme